MALQEAEAEGAMAARLLGTAKAMVGKDTEDKGMVKLRLGGATDNLNMVRAWGRTRTLVQLLPRCVDFIVIFYFKLRLRLLFLLRVTSVMLMARNVGSSVEMLEVCL